MPARPEPLPAGTRLCEKYVIVRHIKTGGMGAVYEVEHVLLGKRMAAKLLLAEFVKRPALLERFRREARAASATGHENIVEVTDLGETRAGVPFLVMELLRGRTLGAELREGPLPPVRAIHVTRQIVAALGAAHAHGIVHRDLKPENVFLIQRGNDADFVKVLDFGIAKLLGPEGRPDAGPAEEPLTELGQVVGTPSYMAPEQARGEEVDHRIDLYAAGAMLYRMVSGQRPFVAQNLNALLYAIAQAAPRRPSELNPQVTPYLEQVILKAMARDPAARYQSAAELDEALAEEDLTLRKGAAAPARPREAETPGWSERSATLVGDDDRPAPPRAGGLRDRVITLAIVALTSLGVVGTGVLLWRWVERRQRAAAAAREAEEARQRVLGTPQPRVMTLRLDGLPPGAVATVDDARVPVPAAGLVLDGRKHRLRVEAEGYQAEEMSFLATGDQVLVVKLRTKKRGKPGGPRAIDGTPSLGGDVDVRAVKKLVETLGDSLKIEE